MQNWTFQGSKNEILAEPGKDGFGVYRWASDNYYLGEWKNDKFNGLGVRRYDNGNSKFGFFENDSISYPYFMLVKEQRQLEIGLVKDESTGYDRCLILNLDTGDWEYANFDKNGHRFGASFNFNAKTGKITIEQYENGSNNQYYIKKVLPINLSHVDNRPFCEGCQMNLSEIKNLKDFVYVTGTDKNSGPFQRVRNSSSMSFGVGITHWPNDKEFQIGQFFGASRDGWYLQKQICSTYEKISFRYRNDTGGLFCLSIWKGLLYLYNEKQTAFFQYEKGYLTFGDRSKSDHYDIEGLGVRMDLANGVIEECSFEKGAVKEVKQALFIEGQKLYRGNKRNKVNPETGYGNYLTKHPNYPKEDWHVGSSSTSSSGSYSSSSSSRTSSTSSTTSSSRSSRSRLRFDDKAVQLFGKNYIDREWQFYYSKDYHFGESTFDIEDSDDDANSFDRDDFEDDEQKCTFFFMTAIDRSGPCLYASYYNPYNRTEPFEGAINYVYGDRSECYIKRLTTVINACKDEVDSSVIFDFAEYGFALEVFSYGYVNIYKSDAEMFQYTPYLEEEIGFFNIDPDKIPDFDSIKEPKTFIGAVLGCLYYGYLPLLETLVNEQDWDIKKGGKTRDYYVYKIKIVIDKIRLQMKKHYFDDYIK